MVDGGLCPKMTDGIVGNAWNEIISEVDIKPIRKTSMYYKVIGG